MEVGLFVVINIVRYFSKAKPFSFKIDNSTKLKIFSFLECTYKSMSRAPVIFSFLRPHVAVIMEVELMGPTADGDFPSISENLICKNHQNAPSCGVLYFHFLRMWNAHNHTQNIAI